MIDQRRRRIAWILAALSGISAALAIWAQVTGGFRIYVFGIPLSVRGELRPALAALIFGVASFQLLDAWRSPWVRRAIAAAPRVLPWLAACVVGWTLIVGLLYGTRTAGGADSSGYVSQSELWLQGDLRLPQPQVGPLPWPDAEWTFSPLGYRPDFGRPFLVPTYAPGLPLLMAAARAIVGVCGPYFVAPLSACLLVWATYVIGRGLADRLVGVLAAGAVAASPAIQMMMLAPMSDVPNAAFWTLSLLFAGRSSRARDAGLAGITAGIAIMIRPNLAPLAAAPGLLMLWTSRPTTASSLLRRALAFAAGCAPFILLVAWVFNHLYGSPLRSGYGTVNETYSVANLGATVASYPRWFLESQGPVAFAFLLTPVAVFYAPTGGRFPRLLYFFFVLAVLGSYLLYTAFDAWWFLRFVLAAFPFAFILGIDSVGILASRYGTTVRRLAVVVTGAALIVTGWGEASARRVIGTGDGERRYADAADYVQRHLPSGAVVMAMQHSGSLNHYTDKLPLRYDTLAPEWVDSAIALFRERGRPVYILLDDWEIPIFAERFSGHAAAALVGAQPIAATVDGRVKLFATDTEGPRGSPVRMSGTHGCLPPVGKK